MAVTLCSGSTVDPLKSAAMDTTIIARNNVRVFGQGTQPMLFAHGFGCDQNMWRFVTPAFEDDYRIVLFDYVGSGKSDIAAYDRDRYASLDGYAQDVLDVCHALDLHDVIFVGHSVSSMIGVLAANRRAGALLAADPGRPVAALHQRPAGLRRRLRAGGHRGAARDDGEELHRLGELPGAGDHEESGPSRAERGARAELLLDRSRSSRAGSPRRRSSPTTAPISPPFAFRR